MGRRVLLHMRSQGLAYLALFVALGSTGYAAGLGRNSVGSKAIKRGAVSTKHLGFPLASAGTTLSDPLTIQPGGTQSLASTTIRQGGSAISQRRGAGRGKLLTSATVVVTNTGSANAVVTLRFVIDGEAHPASATVQLARGATQSVPKAAVAPDGKQRYALELQASVEGSPVSIGSRTLVAQLMPGG